MDCKKSNDLMPEYLAGTLDEATRKEMEAHLAACPACTKEAEALRAAESAAEGGRLHPAQDAEATNRVVKKTRRKFRIQLAMVAVAMLGVIVLFFALPKAILWGIRMAEPAQMEKLRILMDVAQFGQPDKVVGHGYGTDDFFGIKAFVPASTPIGHWVVDQHDISVQYGIWTGRIDLPYFLGSNFMHPDQFKDLVPEQHRDPALRLAGLARNAETTVSTVDLSLKRIWQPEELADALAAFDVELCWLAIEAGVESDRGRTFDFGTQQVLAWGLPGAYSQPLRFDLVKFDKKSLGAWLSTMKDELAWLRPKLDGADENPYLADQGLVHDNKTRIDYVLAHGFRIYGVRLTGPTQAIIDASKALDPRLMSVRKVDFYNW
jgi:hypothetical protein